MDPIPLDQLRPSYLPLFMRCAESARPMQGERVDVWGPHTELGQAVHRRLADVLSGVGCAPIPDAISQSDDFQKLVAFGCYLWREELANTFPRAAFERMVEHESGGFCSRSRFDILSVDITSAAWCDWKTGAPQHLDIEQGNGMSWLLFQVYPELETVSGTFVYLREWSYRTHVYRRDATAAWFERVQEHAQRPRYVASALCGRCARVGECQGYRAWIARSRALLAGTEQPNTIGELHEAVQTMERLCKDVREQMRAEVIRNNGSVGLGGGRYLGIKETQKRRVNPRKAWGVIRSFLDGDDELIAQAIGVRLGALEKLVRTRHGGAAVKELRNELEAAGAVTVELGDQMRATETPPELVDAHNDAGLIHEYERAGDNKVD